MTPSLNCREAELLNIKILVIDDDKMIRDLVTRTFAKEGAEVAAGENGRQGLRKFYDFRPHLVVLDIMMPEIDGWEACRQIRNLSDVPIIMLTSLDQDEDIIRGLDAGADDFLSKPFSPRVLLARARAALRRSDLAPTGEKGAGYQDDYLLVDLEKHLVQVQGEKIKLTAKEYKLLAYLLQNAGRVCTFEGILENVWGWEYQDSIDYVHVYVSHLRRKLEADPKKPRYLQTVHGLGYRFEKQPD
jgi:DNA-binding response OmpR family regulator